MQAVSKRATSNNGRRGDIVWTMIRVAVSLLFLLAVTSRTQSQSSPSPVSVCDLSKDYSAYRNKVVTVRGVSYYGLRQTCPQKCADHPWPSFLWLRGAEAGVFDALGKIENSVELEAKKGKRFEIWVTVTGLLETRLLRGPCDKVGSNYIGYGHLGAWPAQLVVKSISDIEVRENPNSEYDYANVYHGAL